MRILCLLPSLLTLQIIMTSLTTNPPTHPNDRRPTTLTLRYIAVRAVRVYFRSLAFYSSRYCATLLSLTAVVAQPAAFSFPSIFPLPFFFLSSSFLLPLPLPVHLCLTHSFNTLT